MIQTNTLITRKKPNISSATSSALSDLSIMWQEMDKVRSSHLRDILPARPEGSFTALEYADRYQVAESTARRQLQKLIRSGTLIQEYAMVADTAGKTVVTKVYRLPNN